MLRSCGILFIVYMQLININFSFDIPSIRFNFYSHHLFSSIFAVFSLLLCGMCYGMFNVNRINFMQCFHPYQVE